MTSHGYTEGMLMLLTLAHCLFDFCSVCFLNKPYCTDHWWFNFLFLIENHLYWKILPVHFPLVIPDCIADNQLAKV